MQREVRAIRHQLSEKDYRLTPQRESILMILLAHRERHLSADEVYLAARERNLELGLATVYRTLELFAQLGIVHKLDYGDGQSRYEYNAGLDRHYHHHLICLGCGRIIEFNQDLLEDLEREISRKTDFDITDHCLRFFGYCRSCTPAPSIPGIQE